MFDAFRARVKRVSETKTAGEIRKQDAIPSALPDSIGWTESGRGPFSASRSSESADQNECPSNASKKVLDNPVAQPRTPVGANILPSHTKLDTTTNARGSESWKYFWERQHRLGHKYQSELREAVETTVAAQAEWLSRVLSLVGSSPTPETVEDVRSQFRANLAQAKVTDGAMASSAASILSNDFWKSSASTSPETKRLYGELQKVRPSTKISLLVAERVSSSQASNNELSEEAGRTIVQTWDVFWQLQGASKVRLRSGLRTAFERCVEKNAEWLNEIRSAAAPDSEIDFETELRSMLAHANLNSGLVAATVAEVISSLRQETSFRTPDVQKILRMRPSTKIEGYLGGQRDGGSAPRRDRDAKSDNSVISIITQLAAEFSLSDSHRERQRTFVAGRLAEFKRTSESASADQVRSAFLEEMRRRITREQTRIKVNVKRGVSCNDELWASGPMLQACICAACVATNAQGDPPLELKLKISQAEEYLVRDLRLLLQGRVPAKYLDVLQLPLIVESEFALDPSYLKCWSDRASEMASLVVGLFDPSAESPQMAYEAALADRLNSLFALKLAELEEFSNQTTTRAPARRQIHTWLDAEENACDWMQAMGFTDAVLSVSGADQGIDVVSRHAVAQVKREATAVGSPAIQRFFGAAAMQDAEHKLFFSGSGYSRAAYDAAEKLGIALFTYQLDGRITPEDSLANELFDDGNILASG